MKALRSIVFILFLTTPLGLINGCGEGDSVSSSLLIKSVSGSANIVGTWSMCTQSDPDTSFSLTFTTDTYDMEMRSYDSTDGSCLGIDGLIDSEHVTFTLEVTKVISAWSNESSTVSPPSRADGTEPLPATPNVQKAMGNNGISDFPILAYIDDTGDVDRLYLDTETPASPCAIGGDGYPNCLGTRRVLERQ